MYTPSFKTKKNGVPVLDRKEIDNIGENFIRDFQPSVLTSPAPVDIENFTEFYLGMTPDYQYLSHNGIYLGMTVFNDTKLYTIFGKNSRWFLNYGTQKHNICVGHEKTLKDTLAFMI